jgi:hypothetical protein
MSTLFERASQQYQQKMADTPLLSIEIPEWPDENAAPSRLYFKPANRLRLREFSRFLELARLQTVEAALDIIVLRALDEKQQPIFHPAQRAELQRHVDPEVILAIIKRMGEAEERYTAEREEKGLRPLDIASKNIAPMQ